MVGIGLTELPNSGSPRPPATIITVLILNSQNWGHHGIWILQLTPTNLNSTQVPNQVANIWKWLMVPRTLVDHDRCLKRNRNIPPICPLFLGLLKTSRIESLSLSTEILKKCKRFWSFQFWKTNENDTNKQIQNVFQIKTIFLKSSFYEKATKFWKKIPFVLTLMSKNNCFVRKNEL